MGLKEKLEQRFKDYTQTRQGRRYLGCSAIGHPCERYLWLSIKRPYSYQLSLQQKRIFERGELEEGRIKKLLEEMNVTIVDWQVPTAAGPLQGTADGIIEEGGEKYLLEIKTMNQANFTKVVRLGVQEANFQYWAQCHAYMGLLNLKQALFLSVNKNREEVYLEEFPFKPAFFKALQEKAKRIENSNSMPLGYACYKKPAPVCKFCPFYHTCWKYLKVEGKEHETVH